MTQKEQILSGNIRTERIGGRIIGWAGYDKSRHPRVIFECDCGQLSTPRLQDLDREEKTYANGKTYKPTRSCGHLKDDAYLAWLDAKLGYVPLPIQIQMWVSAQGKKGVSAIAGEHRVDRAVALHAVRTINKAVTTLRDIAEKRDLLGTYLRLRPALEAKGRTFGDWRYPEELTPDEFVMDKRGIGGTLGLAVIQSKEILERFDWLRRDFPDRNILKIFEAAQWLVDAAQRTLVNRMFRRGRKAREFKRDLSDGGTVQTNEQPKPEAIWNAADAEDVSIELTEVGCGDGAFQHGPCKPVLQ